MEICAATNNKHKLEELRRILGAQGHTVKAAAELGVFLDPEETGTTFEENARIKAQAICKAANMPTLADDSGIAVDFLKGAPGVYSARWAGEHGNDEANNEKLLAELAGLPAEQRGAQFVSVVCLCLPTGEHLLARGECPGTVAFTHAGENGFGYDPLFCPTAYPGRTYAQLTAEEKDQISHRGNALAALAVELPAFLEGQKK